MGEAPSYNSDGVPNATRSNDTGNFRRVIGKDGSINLVPTSEVSDPSQDKGFRKGMLALRDMKMHWTRKLKLLNRYPLADSQVILLQY